MLIARPMEKRAVIPTAAAMAPAMAPICSWLLWVLRGSRAGHEKDTYGFVVGRDVGVWVWFWGALSDSWRGWMRRVGVDSCTVYTRWSKRNVELGSTTTRRSWRAFERPARARTRGSVGVCAYGERGRSSREKERLRKRGKGMQKR